MQLAPILSPQGLPLFSAGGSHSWKTFEHRGFIVSLEWMGRGKKAQPCMVIWPSSNVFVAGEGQGMWAIGRRAITEFVGFNADGTCTGSASQHCYRECLAALPVLGKDQWDKQSFLALVDCVIRFAPDLVHMPVTPRRIRQELAGEPMWEIEAKNKVSGKTISEVAI